MYSGLVRRCFYISLLGMFLLLIFVACGGASDGDLVVLPEQPQIANDVGNNVIANNNSNEKFNLTDLNYRSMPMAKSEAEPSDTESKPLIPKLRPLAITGTSRIGLRLLIISANGNPAIRDGTDPMLDSATYFAEQIGIPFDVMIATTEQLTEARLLAANGDGKYQGIILTNGSLTFNNAGVFESAFDTAEWNLLWQYAREFNVRQLSLDSFPGVFPEDLGLREAGSVSTTTDSALNVGITTEGQNVFSSLKATATIPVKNAFVNLASICSENPALACPTGVTTTPILRTSDSNQIVGTITTTADNREILNLTMAHNFFLTHTSLLSYDLFNWVTQGVFIGAREMYLQLDIDDWYQASALWDPAANAIGSDAYRITGFDVQSTKAQLNDLKSRFSVVPNLNISNFIVAAQGEFTDTLDCSNSASLEGATLCVKDDFDWVSHTYTERTMYFESPGYNSAADPLYNPEDPELNGTFKGFTCNDASIAGFTPATIGEEIALKELICNSQKLLQLGIPFNPNSVVTSAFSGLGQFNPDPLNPNRIDNGLENSSVGLMAALTNAGIRYIGSNHSVLSQRGVCEVCGRQHPLYPQVFLIPRYPTYIFFNVNEPTANIDEFNFLFGPNGQFVDGFGNNFFDSDLTYNEMIELDAEITLRHVTSLQPYMHYFHQNNLRNYTGGTPGRSLLYDWTEAFLELYSSYYTVPLITLDWADQAANIERRTSFFNSGVQGVWDRATGIVSVTSTNGGFVYLTNAGFSDVPTSSYGGDVIQKFGLAAGETRLSSTTGPTQNPSPLPIITPVIPPPAEGNPVNPPAPTDPNIPINPTNPVDPNPVNPTPINPNNLLVNGGFENNQASWSICGTGQTSIVTDRTEGSNAMNLSGDGACLYQEIDITAAETYTLVCDAKRNDNSTWSSLAMSFNNDDYTTEYPGELKEIVGSAFGQLSVSAIAPAGAARAVAVLYSQDNATVDNCVLFAGTGGNPQPPQPPQPPTGSNALVNGDFENGQAGWINCSAQGISTDNDAVSGASALRVTNSGCVYQEIESSPGSDLTLSCLAKRTDDRFTSMTFSYLDSNFQSLLEQSTPISSTDYQSYSVNLAAPANTAFAVATFYSDSNAHFDACVLSGDGAVAPPPTPAPPTGNNLLVNGGFESGRTGWNDCSQQGLSVDSDFDSGTSALRVTNGGCIYQEVDINASIDLTLSCQAKQSGAGFTSMTLSYLDSNFQLLQDGPVTVIAPSYQKYGSNLVAPANASLAVVTLYSDAVAHFDTCFLGGAGSVDPTDPTDPTNPPTPTEQNSIIVDSTGSGQWGAVQPWPLIATHMANMTDGRVMAWSSYDVARFGGVEGNTLYTQAVIFDPATGGFQEADNPSHDMFCAGLATLSDGTIFAAGGGGGNANRVQTSIFNGSSWSSLAPMPNAHWYGTAVVNSSDDVLVSLGASAGGTTDFYENGTWRNLPGVNLAGTTEAELETPDWYPQMHLTPRGTIFHSGGTTQMHEIDTAGNATTTAKGDRNQDGVTGEVYRQWATAVLIDDGQIMMTGGTPQQSSPGSLNSNVLIDVNGTDPVVTRLAPMSLARSFHDTLILPTGEILVVGGNSTGVEFNDGGSQLAPEIYNPTTNTWRTVDALGEPRNYHSSTTLLQDGRVLAAGGGLCGCAADHQNGEIFSPPYLFNADGSTAARPVIGAAPSNIGYNQSFDVTVTGAGAADIVRFSMIRFSATTHSMNSDLRQDALSFINQGNGSYELTSGSNPNVIVPGYYYLFAINNAGVPSVASIIQIN